MKKKILLILLSLILLGYSVTSFAEVIQLKSGEKIEGKVIERTDEYIKVDEGDGTPTYYFLNGIETVNGEIIVQRENQKQIPSTSENLSNDTNAAIIYKKAGSMLTKLPDDFIKEANDIIKNSWIGNNEELKEILMKNQEAIKEFKEATKLTNCDFLFGKSVNITTSLFMPELTNLARLIILEGMLYENENRLDAVLEDYLSILRFAEHWGQQRDLVGTTIESIILRLVYAPLIRCINQENLSIKDYQYLLDNLNFLKDNKIGLEKAIIEDKEVMEIKVRMLVDEASKKQAEKMKGQKVNTTLNQIYIQNFNKEYERLTDEYYEYLITAFKENRPEIYTEKINQLEKEIKPFEAQGKTSGQLLSEMTSPYYTAKVLVSMGRNDIINVITMYYISLTKLNTLITAVAIKLYESKNGKIPDNLQELMPTYFAKLPEDPFDDFKPLKYKKKDNEWILYGFGPNRKDDGAEVIFNEEEAFPTTKSLGDIVFVSM